ncbi:DUF927 domain-containing protein [Neisseria weixii]|uniref:DUF927 domain-containing protein n=1 Tax=Neisseria weixii TaxID=1853276 RepID=A0A3N4NAY6_9NEIS|nr:DUF927 domain-containing protein [Neisseria weixii]RPD87080.1 DUF927 domain-containing protein [Neisseria weixii]RPD89260.1 DUF927 domain-containing protein [Neisseria weixii]
MTDTAEKDKQTGSKPDFIKLFEGVGSMNGESYQLKPRYEVSSNGVQYIGITHDKDGNSREQPPLLLADPIELIGRGIDEQGSHYRIIEWRDRLTRQTKQAAIPQADIGSNAGWRQLQQYGITILSGRVKRERLADYLQNHGSNRPYTITDRAGWHGGVYLLPNGEAIHHGKEAPRIIYNGDTSQAAAYTPAGTLEAWQQQIARYAAGNSRLCLALGTALAAPLLSLLGEESGGFHLYGDSSDGKTTAARVALSVWGRPSESIMTWQGTALAFNNTAAARNDGLLVLDEISQAAPKVIGNTVYSLMNGVNKAQGAKDGGNRALTRWRVLMLSTGEKTPSSILKADNDWNAGQATRLPNIRAAAQYGIYDTLHGFTDGALLSEHLQEAAEQHHGHAGRAFIRLTDQTAPAAVKERIAAFTATLPELSGQARRVARRFALVAAALEMAAPVTGLPAGVGMAGVKQCFDEWLATNGTGKYEDEKIKEQTSDFMQRFGQSVRFTDWNSTIGSSTDRNHAGWIKRGGQKEADEYWIIPAVFIDEICGSFDRNKVCRVLYDANWLKRNEKENRFTYKKRGYGAHYVLIGIEPPEPK